MTVRISWENAITTVAVAGIAAYLGLRYGAGVAPARADIALWVVLAVGGIPILIMLGRRMWEREFGSDLLAGIGIVAAVVAGEYLVGAIIVVMLAGGSSLEQMATRRASQVLDALARRMPQLAHRERGGAIEDVPLAAVEVGDRLLVLPHEVCPVDGTVIAGHATMDESYLTGEPFAMAKAPGSQVISGAINGEAALTIVADKLAVDSRYAKIMAVMAETAQRQPRLRRLGDRLGAWYTPLAVAIAVLAWVVSGEGVRFLAVIVIATPCPLILAIPVAVVGAISLSARHAIIIKNPAALERIVSCRIVILDKTGTLTYGRPEVTEIHLLGGLERREVLQAAASLEAYSKHPLARAVVQAAEKEGLRPQPVSEISEPPGQGLRGITDGRRVRITGRGKLAPEQAAKLPAIAPGLECVVLLEEDVAAVFRFRDEPRGDVRPFIGHLGPRHAVERVLLVSGDRESEVRHLAGQAGISEVHAEQTPEQKLASGEAALRQAPTLFVGDGINDAPALTAATVGVAFGPGSDIAAEAADAVILDPSLLRVDQLLHIGRRMRAIALQSAGFGMAASVIGMAAAAVGWLPPLAGAIAQEGVDLFAVLNAVRAALPGRSLADY
ncbi:MAG TPA: heavy metal translocating P-type ATPase [Terriglobales bacterium]|nr:heavy metal translocating P-type ATPase [Terriglobales bacterium]